MAYNFARLACVATILLVFTPGTAVACPICFGGDPDSQIAQSVNWAVFALLGITGGVLSGFVGFIFHLIKRSRMSLGQDQGQQQGEPFDG